MRYFRLKMIALAAGLTFTLVYASLRHSPFGFDAALCSSFSVMIFGAAIRKRGFGLFAKPLTEILLVHAASLAGLMMILYTGIYLTPRFPGWLITQVGADNQGPVGPTGLQLIQSLAIFLLGYIEVRVLTANKPVEAGEEPARASRLGRADLDADRMSGLRLR